MPRYKVMVSEHIAHKYVVEAPDEKEAEKLVENGACDLEPDDSDTLDWFVAGVMPEDDLKSLPSSK